MIHQGIQQREQDPRPKRHPHSETTAIAGLVPQAGRVFYLSSETGTEQGKVTYPGPSVGSSDETGLQVFASVCYH